MALIKCSNCGKLISSERLTGLCSNCNVEDTEDTFQKVRSFVYDHPRVPISVVSEETGVSERLIKQYVKDGRLELVTELAYECVSCGKSISSGKYCMDCSTKLKKELQSVSAEKDKPRGVEYHSSKK